MNAGGLRRACQWPGNIPDAAMKNYALTKNEDFDDSGLRKIDARSDAILANDAKSDAEWASTREQKPNKKRTVKNERSTQCVKADGEGFEPPVRVNVRRFSKPVPSTRLSHPSETCFNRPEFSKRACADKSDVVRKSGIFSGKIAKRDP